MPTRRPLLLTLAAVALPFVVIPIARALDAPTGGVVLTIEFKASGRKVDFDMAMLAKLPQRSFTTATPWYPKPRTFTGPLLRDVLAAAGASGAQLRLIALNDFRVGMPASDADKYDVVLARLLDGQPMPVREKGPLFVIYPYDSHPELQSELFFNRSAWQLRTIEVQ
ncbi:MAG TPA: hypothetical protein VJO99_15690 [Burkholderiaceae bacterium]|nr:hypothetical protein [Burkholderiaceae bacterium]